MHNRVAECVSQAQGLVQALETYTQPDSARFLSPKQLASRIEAVQSALQAAAETPSAEKPRFAKEVTAQLQVRLWLALEFPCAHWGGVPMQVLGDHMSAVLKRAQSVPSVLPPLAPPDVDDAASHGVRVRMSTVVPAVALLKRRAPPVSRSCSCARLSLGVGLTACAARKCSNGRRSPSWRNTVKCMHKRQKRRRHK